MTLCYREQKKKNIYSNNNSIYGNSEVEPKKSNKNFEKKGGNIENQSFGFYLFIYFFLLEKKKRNEVKYI